MAIYAVGDLQGCYREFRELLDLVRFDETKDKLWLVGDLVNRGPDSLSVLRFVRELNDSAIMVLGNHDLHLLMVAEGCTGLNRSDTLKDILDAPIGMSCWIGCDNRSCCMWTETTSWCTLACCPPGAWNRRKRLQRW